MNRGEYTPTANGGRYEHWTRERDRQLRDLFAAGKSDDEIASALSTTTPRVAHRRHRLKLNRRRAGMTTATKTSTTKTATPMAKVTIDGEGVRIERMMPLDEALALASLVLGGGSDHG